MAGNISTVYLEAKDNITPVLEDMRKNLTGVNNNFDKLSGTLVTSMLKTHLVLKGFDALRDSYQSFKNLFKTGLEVQVDTEKTQLGIAATLATVYELRDALTGETLTGANKFNAAMEQSDAIMRRLTISAITTSASVKDVREAFSAAVAFGAQIGMKPEQVERMSTMIANASKIFGLQEGQASQELRTILTGKIDKTSTIGTSLGLGDGGPLEKEFKAALARGGDILSDFMDKTLEEYSRAATTMGQKLSGMFDSAKETFNLFAKDISYGLGEQLLKIKSEVIDRLFVVDKNKGLYQWSEDLMPVVGLLNYVGSLIGQGITNSIKNVVDWLVRGAKFLMEWPKLVLLTENTLKGVISVVSSSIGIIWSTFTGIFSFFDQFFTTLGNGLNFIFDGIVNIGLAFMGYNTIQEESVKKGEKLKETPGTLVKLWAGAVAGITTLFSYMESVIKNWDSVLSIVFIDTILMIYNAVSSASKLTIALISDIGQALGELVNYLDSDLGNAIVNFSKKLGTLVTKDPKFIENLRNVKTTIAKEMDVKDLEATLKQAQKTMDDAFKAKTANPVKDWADKLKKEQNNFKNLMSTLQTKENKVKPEANTKAREEQYKANKKFHEDELKLWDLYNSYGLIELKTYFDKRNQLQNESYQEELRYLQNILSMYKQKQAAAGLGKSGDSQKEAAAATEKVIETEGKIAELKRKNFYDSQKSFFEEEKAMNERKWLMDDYLAQIEELRGNTREAFKIKIGIEFDKLENQYRGQPDVLGRIKELKELKTLQGEFNLLKDSYSIISEKLGIDEVAAQNKVKLGLSTELGYYKELKDLRMSSYTELEQKIKSMEALGSQDPKVINNIKSMRNELDALKLTLDPLKQKFDELFVDTLTENLIGVIDGTKSLSDAFKSLTKTIEQEITKLVAKNLAQQFAGAIFPNSGQVGGGWLSGIGNFASNLFNLMGRASGGAWNGLSPLLVGEAGPELLMPTGRSGFIYNTPKTNDIMNNRSGVVNNYNINVVSNTPEAWRGSEKQIANTIQRVVSQGNKIS